MVRPDSVRRVVWTIAAALPLAVRIAAYADPRPAAPVQTPDSAAQSAEFFEAKVRPLLVANCYDCHTDLRSGGLRLDSRDALLKGGRSGPAIVPGDPDRRLAIEAVRQTNDKLKLPKGGHLKPEEIDTLAQWIRGGAPWPAAVTTTAAGDTPHSAAVPPSAAAA